VDRGGKGLEGEVLAKGGSSFEGDIPLLKRSEKGGSQKGKRTRRAEGGKKKGLLRRSSAQGEKSKSFLSLSSIKREDSII